MMSKKSEKHEMEEITDAFKVCDIYSDGNSYFSCLAFSFQLRPLPVKTILIFNENNNKNTRYFKYGILDISE